MPVLTAPQKVTLRTHPHKIKLYLAVLKPSTIYSARVDDNTIGKGERTIIFDGGVGSVANIRNGMSLWISDGTDGAAGQQDKGRVRVKSATDQGGGVGTIVVAENDHIDWEDNDFLTVRGIYEFWVVYPRLTNTGGLTHYKDYDITYSDQNLNLSPVPIMGPPACAFIDGGVATVYFDGQDSYCLGSSIQWGSGNSKWTFPGGSPATSNLATPGNVTWDTPGTYMVRLKAKAANGKITYGYRPVFIFERSGVNAPYTNFTVRSARCSAKDGGWSHSYEVHGDADAGEFPEGTMAVLFAEASYGNTAKDFGMNHPGRHNIRGVGWIVKDSVKKQPETGTVTFDTQGVAGLMKSRQNFMCALNYVSGTPDKWFKLKELDTDRALHHYLRWHTTVFKMTDVRVSGELHPTCAGPFKIKFQDFARGSIWAGLSKLCEEAFLIPVADRASCLYLDYNPQVLIEADRTKIDTVMLLTHADRGGDLVMSYLLEKKTNFVDFEGIAFDGTTAEPVISYAPGKTPEYSGGPKPSKRHVLDPAGDWQAKSNVRAGLKLAWDNNPWPDIKWPAAGDYSVADIAPREWFTLTLLAGDTKRGVVWDEQRLLVAAIAERYDVVRGTCQTQFTFEKEAIGPPGVTGDYPPPEPPEPPKPPPPPPEPPGPEGDGRKVIISTLSKGLLRLDNIYVGSPVWAQVNSGLVGDALKTNGWIRDSWDPSDTGLTFTEDGIYRATNLQATVPTWTQVLSNAEIDALVTAGWGGDAYDCRVEDLRSSICQEGLMFAIVSNGRTGYERYRYCLRSINGGTDWTYRGIVQGDCAFYAQWVGIFRANRVTPEAPMQGNLYLSSHDANKLWVFCDTCYGAANRRATLLYSPDQGTGWSVVSQAVFGVTGPASGMVPYSNNAADQRMYSWNWGPNVEQKSTVGGASWVAINPPMRTYRKGMLMEHTWNELLVVAVGDTQFAISEDGADSFGAAIAHDLVDAWVVSGFPYNQQLFYFGRDNTALGNYPSDPTEKLITITRDRSTMEDKSGNLRADFNVKTITGIVPDWLS